METEKVIKKTLNDYIFVIREYERYLEQYNRVLVRMGIPAEIVDMYLNNVNPDKIR